MKSWYVYKITFGDNKFYIGYRGAAGAVEDDFLIKYFSSSKEVKRKILENEIYYGTIISTHIDKEIAYNVEQELISIEIDNPDILNKFCYKNRKGYGLLTAAAKQKISETTKERWKDPAYRTSIVESHKNRWTDELKNKQSIRLTGK